MEDAARLLLGLACVLASSWLFTEGLEWLGARLHLPSAVLGTVFAALGTALPEASIAVLAALVRRPPDGGAAAGSAVSIGAVLGAPLLLSTVGFTVLGIGALRAGRRQLRVAAGTVRRDLLFFLCTFGAAAAIGVAGLSAGWRAVAAALLVLAYGLFIIATLSDGSSAAAPAERPRRLFLAFGGAAGADPPSALIGLQLGLAVALMVGGAELFVHTLTGFAARAQISGFVLSALIAPLATELPETLNSIVWIGRDRDALATGNVTGAMALQGAVIPALGLVFTPWHFTFEEGAAAVLAVTGAAVVAVALWREGRLRPWLLVGAGVLYAVFVIWAL